MPRDVQENPAGEPATPAVEGHNVNAREATLLHLSDRLRQQMRKLDELMAPVKAQQKVVQTTRTALQQAGFELWIIDLALKRETQGNRRQQAVQAEQMAFIFRAFGLPFGDDEEQLDMFADGTDEEKLEFFWGADGYNTGVRGLPALAPLGMPPEFLQTWLKRHAAGVERLRWAQSEQGQNPEARSTLGEGQKPAAGAKAADAPKPAAEPKAEGDDGEEGDGHNPKDPLLH